MPGAESKHFTREEDLLLARNQEHPVKAEES